MKKADVIHVEEGKHEQNKTEGTKPTGGAAYKMTLGG